MLRYFLLSLKLYFNSMLPRNFCIRRNNNNVDSTETGRIVVHHITNLEAVAKRCSMKKVFLEISQNSQENTCARVSF